MCRNSLHRYREHFLLALDWAFLLPVDLAILPPIEPQTGKFWLMGETPASRSLAQALDIAGLPWLATVGAAEAVRLYAGLKGEVQVRAIALEPLSAWLAQEQIGGILDASPLLAAHLSQEAIATGLPYLRFERPCERPALPLGDTRPDPRADTRADSMTTVVATWEEVCRAEILAGQRVLLTVGSKALPWFVPWLERAHLWARLLPGGVERAIAAGFPGDRLLEQKLPRTLAQEQALWQRMAITQVITTPSSTTGGLTVKQAVAEILGVQLRVVARPDLRYPQATSDLAEAIAFAQRVSQGWEQSSPLV